MICSGIVVETLGKFEIVFLSSLMQGYGHRTLSDFMLLLLKSTKNVTSINGYILFMFWRQACEIPPESVQWLFVKTLRSDKRSLG